MREFRCLFFPLKKKKKKNRAKIFKYRVNEIHSLEVSPTSCSLLNVEKLKKEKKTTESIIKSSKAQLPTLDIKLGKGGGKYLKKKKKTISPLKLEASSLAGRRTAIASPPPPRAQPSTLYSDEDFGVEQATYLDYK